MTISISNYKAGFANAANLCAKEFQTNLVFFSLSDPQAFPAFECLPTQIAFVFPMRLFSSLLEGVS